MISKNLFFKLIKQDMKRRIWCPILIFVACFLGLEVRLLMDMEEFVRYPNAHSYSLAVYIREYFFGRDARTMAIVVCMAAFLCGLSGYAYLHSKIQIDLYHSLPVSRSRFFWARYLSGVMQFCIPFVLNVAVCTGIAASRKAVTAETILAILSFIGIEMIIFVLAYSVAVIAAGLTGNVIVSILGTGVLFAYSAGLELLKFLMAERFYDTYTVYDSRGHFIFDGSVWCFSPISMMIKFFSSPNNTTMAQAQKFFKYDTSYVGVLIVAAVLYSLAAYFIFMKRASEAAGKPIAFRIAEPVIKTMVVLPSAFLTGFFFCSISSTTNTDRWFLFGVFFGFTVICILMEIIYRLSLRGALMHKKQFLFNAVCTALIFVIFRYDVAGYDTYVPADAQLQSCAVSISGLMPLAQEIRVNEFGVHVLSSGEYRMANMELQGNASVMELARKAAKEQLEIRYFDYYEGIENSTEYLETLEKQNNYRVIEFGYKLSNGKNIYRKYIVDIADSDTLRLLSDIFNDYNYKIGATPLFNDSWNIAFDTVRCESNFKREDITLTPQMQSELIGIYQKEYMNLTLDTIMYTAPVGTVDFLFKENRKDDILYTSYSGKMYVYPQFTETLALIKEYGVDMQEKPNVEDVALIRVNDEDMYPSSYLHRSPYDIYEAKSEVYSDEENEEAEYSSKEQVQQILDSIISDGVVWMAKGYSNFYENQYVVNIQYKKKDLSNLNVSYHFVKGKIPAFIQ
ncbi:MAG: hypothetical protein K2O40_05950 [Lachnospiraceae bacterium]|nr:hypothetical protein [Lachnospiraceae bacterium]MDE7184015.1 hypothetical protein [Lachnospiraceae bacterium]